MFIATPTSAQGQGKVALVIGNGGYVTVPPRAPAPSADVEALAWQGALAANTRAGFEDYLRQYPSGRFAGVFRMGAEDHDPDEKPIASVTIAKPFAIGRYEVTFADYDARVRIAAVRRARHTRAGAGSIIQ
jgi:hypothetical protein